MKSQKFHRWISVDGQTVVRGRDFAARDHVRERQPRRPRRGIEVLEDPSERRIRFAYHRDRQVELTAAENDDYRDAV